MFPTFSVPKSQWREGTLAAVLKKEEKGEEKRRAARTKLTVRACRGSMNHIPFVFEEGIPGLLAKSEIHRKSSTKNFRPKIGDMVVRCEKPSPSF